MNTLFDFLNHVGQRFEAVAEPLFWQSTLLIALVWLADRALRNKLRASVRCALWLVVLVKLATPPTLAAPTGLGWWLRETRTVQISAPEVRVVENGAVPFVSSPSAPTPSRQNVSPKNTSLSGLGWCALLWLTGVAGLASWILFRWRSVARLVREASPAPESLVRLLDQARKSAGIKQQVELRLTHQPISPAVCGLAHAVILLPTELAGRLSEASLKSVLLHELVHLRRCDVWVNCAQALIQVVYWWHPLLWMANARIRHLREEAVDDAVVVALGSESDGYAPTLLEVARLALDRPMSTLGLVGILESHNSLKQRIARLVNFTAPRKAGLTVFSLVGIAAFAAAALPMEPATNSTPVNTLLEPARDADTPVTSTATNFPTTGPSILTQAKIMKVNVSDVENAPKGSPIASFFKALSTNGVMTVETNLFGTNSQSATPIAGRSAILTAEEMKALVEDFQKRSGTESLGAPKILTRDGQQARIFIGDALTVVAAVTAHSGTFTWIVGSPLSNAAAINAISSVTVNSQNTNVGKHAIVNYSTTNIQVGHGMDVIATIQPGGKAVRLAVTVTETQFLGYDSAPPITVTNQDGSPLSFQQPLPKVRKIELSTTTQVEQGQSLVFCSGEHVKEVVMKDKVPVLGDIPLIGGLFRHQSTNKIKEYRIFIITPTIIKPETPVKSE